MEKFVIFLSHITVESKLADLLKKRLVRDFIGLVRVFESSDRISILAGTQWLGEVTENLQCAHIHLILCSPESTSRPWIQFEAGAAHLRGIPIIPICHSGLEPAQLPVPISVYEGVKASEPEGVEALYRTIAAQLGSAIPDVDFGLFAKDVAAFEAEYAAQRGEAQAAPSHDGNLERIPNPLAICISSPQFQKLGFENQLDVVLKAFPPALVSHPRVFSSAELRDAMSNNQKFDIVHIAAFVCPRLGDLYFSDVDLNTGKSIAAEPDILKAEAVAYLFREAGAKLVVISSCDSIALAITLVKTCHVIAARDMVSPRMMASWVQAFYEKLPNQSLSQALEYALNMSQAPMRFYGRQIEKDMMFVKEPDRAAIAV